MTSGCRPCKRANEIRTERAQLKRDLKAGKVKIETLLLDPPEYVGSAKVFDMILAVPKYGRVKANRILNQCRISPSKTIGGLSERQRAELVACCAEVSRPHPAARASASALPWRRFRDHRALRGRQGDADPRAAASGSRSSSSRSRRRPASRRGRARRTGATTTSSTARSSTAGPTPATSSSTRPTAATATGRCAREVERRLAAGSSVVLEIEVQGARQVREAMPEAVLIFIAPPDPRRCASGSRAAAPTPPRRSRRGCGRPRTSSPPSRSSARGRQRRRRPGRRRAGADRARRAELRGLGRRVSLHCRAE